MHTSTGDHVNPPPQQQALRAKCVHPTSAFTAFRKEEIEQSIPERFEEQARRHSQRLAIKAQDHQLTYDELNAAANRIAHAILADRGERHEHVALIFRQGAMAVAAILGVLKAGRAYVPLDPDAPKARNAHILRHAQTALILTDNGNTPLACELAGADFPVMNVDRFASGLPSDNPGLPIPPDRLSFLIYTSGSTGEPKGVVQNHRNVLYKTMGWVNVIRLSPGDRLSLLRSLSVSGSIRDLFGGLLCGASVNAFDVKTKGFTHLADWLTEEGITIFSPVVTLFRNFGATLTGAENFSAVRLIKLSGEPVQKRDIEIYRKYFPETCLVINMLAAAEAGSVRVFFMDKETPLEENVVPVGYPLEGCEVLLLDADGNRLGCNEVGEIAVRSRFLSPGYWKMPALTETTFVSDPAGGDARIFRTGDLGCMLPDQCLLHRGRKDAHVKIRGYSVELGEIEAALIELDGVKETVVTTKDDPQGNQTLVAYVVPKDKSPVTTNAIRKALTARLPDYMIPSFFIFLRSFPLIGPGKVNRRALPEPGRARPELDAPFVLPRTPLEQAIAAIWAEVLNLDQIGIHDRFLELGGNSLTAARVISQVLDVFRVDVPLRSFFETPTVASMAAVVTQIAPPVRPVPSSASSVKASNET